MPRPAALAVAAALALAAAGCATSACQDLGERICACQNGMTQDTCRAQVQDQLNGLGVDTPGLGGILDRMQAGQPLTFEDYCQQRLDACVAPDGVVFCEWLLTRAGKDACGLTPANPP
jgi:hypothetical protein